MEFENLMMAALQIHQIDVQQFQKIPETCMNEKHAHAVV